MSDCPLENDEANLKYKLALIDLQLLSDRPPNMELVREKWKLETKLKNVQADKILLEME